MEIYTIGVYGSTEESFFKKLTDNKLLSTCSHIIPLAYRRYCGPSDGASPF